MAHILADRLTVEFPLYHLRARSLKKSLLGRGRLRADAQDRVVVSALHELSFNVAPGERIGLFGHNGAGKTTLLRTLAGVFEPVGGRIEVAGTVGTLIDPAAGMDLESTGRENILLRGLYRGMTRAQSERVAGEIAEFSGLAEFLDVPVRTYSAGMQVRLSFAMATVIAPEILLMDEWFLAGDADFMARAEDRLTRLVNDAEILVLASHSVPTLRAWCTRVLTLDRGRIVADGPPEVVLADAA